MTRVPKKQANKPFRVLSHEGTVCIHDRKTTYKAGPCGALRSLRIRIELYSIKR